MFAKSWTIFFEFQSTSAAGLFLNPVISIAGFGAFQPDVLSHRSCVPIALKELAEAAAAASA
jgi:hypothetical protein